MYSFGRRHLPGESTVHCAREGAVNRKGDRASRPKTPHLPRLKSFGYLRKDTYPWRHRITALHPAGILVFGAILLAVCSAADGQSLSVDDRPRLLLDAEVGSETALGYELPSIWLGSSIEIPVEKRFELQAAGAYSPDKKQITNDGHLASMSGTAIGFINQRAGLTASVESSWLWTSQFDKAALFPSAGVVVRNDYFGPGRFYISYIFPTGCVAATASDPCRIQSNRLQGVTVRQDVRSFSHTRWGFESGFYHFCAEGNPNEPEISRNCHWGVTGMAIVRFEFHLGNRSRGGPDAAKSDNF
jgi:hypothetical protein